MKRFIITGPSKAVNGIVNISGAKNSCLPLMAASILFKKEVILRNVPLVQDVLTMKDLLISLGSKVKILEKKKIMIITNKRDHKLTVPYNLVSTMRAGVLTMGSLLGRYPKKNIRVAQGGGCALGIRDTSWHLEGFKSLGAEHVLEKGYVKISSKNGLVGKSYKFPKITVTGTSNLIMSSVFVRGSHVLKNISLEPEVTDLIKFLNNSGANIKFIGKRSLRIKGVKELLSGNHKIIGDRIEAFSYLCVGAITKGNVKVVNINPKFLPSELKILKKMGFKIIKAIKIKEEKDIDKYKEFTNADKILFDTPGMEKSLEFPKNLITKLPQGENYALAGSVSEDNLQNFYKLGVNFFDLSSSLESQLGYKDHLKIRSFISKINDIEI